VGCAHRYRIEYLIFWWAVPTLQDCPSLPGCVSQGETKKEALANIKEAIELYIESLVEHKEPVPPDIDVEVESVAI